MDIPLNTLLVALMFVTILSMGIGNILGSLADIFNHASPSRRDRVHVGWIVLVLLVHFNLFWQTKAILDVEDWQFSSFLLAMAGPVLLFFATSILLTDPPMEQEPQLGRFFVALGKRFFLMFAVVQAWVVFIGYSISGTLVATDTVNILFGILAVGLALVRGARTQTIGLGLAWALVLLAPILRWLGA